MALSLLQSITLLNNLKMDSLILFLLASSLCLCLLPLATGADMAVAGLTATADKETNAIKSIYYAWNISDWKPYMDDHWDICNANGTGTAWPYIKCTDCPRSGAPSNSCHIVSLNLSSQNINGRIPPELFDLQWLTNLSLRNNSISDQILPANGTLSNITYLDLSMNNFSGKIPEEISNLTGLTYLNLSKNMLSGSVPSKLGDIATLKYLDLSVNMLSGNVPSELGNLTNLQVLKFSTNNFSGPLPLELGNLTSLEELYFDSSGVTGSLDVLKPLRNLWILWAFDNDIDGELTVIRNFPKLEELRIYGTLIGGPIPHFSDLVPIQTLQIGDLLPPSVISSSETDSDFSFLKNMSNLRILSMRNCSLTSSTFPTIPVLKNLTYLDLSFNKLRGKIPPNYTESFFPELTQLFIGGNKLHGSFEDIISKSLLNGELDISFNPISGSLSSYPNLNINFLGTNIDAQTLFGNSRGSDILNFIGNKSLQSNITNLTIVGSPFAIKCGADVRNIPPLSYYHNDSDHLGAADFNFDPKYQWVVSNVGSFLTNNNTIDSIVNTEHSISGGKENQVLYQTARISASSLRYYIVGLPDGDGYKIEIDFAEIVIEDQNSWRGLGRRYFNIFIQDNEVEKDFNIVDAANGSYVVITKSYNVTIRNRTLDLHFQWAGRGTCCIPHEYTYGPLVSAIRVFRDQPSPSPSPSPGKAARKKAGLAVGIMSLGIASLLISSSIMYLWWQWIRLGRVMKG